MVALHFLQAFDEDASEGIVVGAVKQDGWRHHRWVAKINSDAVALIGANTLAVEANGKALLGAGSHNVAQRSESKSTASGATLHEQFLNADPAFGIEDEANVLGRVTQDVAEKFAQGCIVTLGLKRSSCMTHFILTTLVCMLRYVVRACSQACGSWLRMTPPKSNNESSMTPAARAICTSRASSRGDR